MPQQLQPLEYVMLWKLRDVNETRGENWEAYIYWDVKKFCTGKSGS